MKLNKLLYFKTIVEQGQISRAARVLHVSQPPLSQQLKELEEDLGVVLVERKARKLEVTREGWALYQRALQILDLVDDIPTEIQRHQGEVEGVATIGCSALLMSSCSKFVFHLRKKYPKINFRCLFEDTSALEHKLRKHAVHFCVMLPPYSRTGLELFPLSITRPCVVIPPSLQTEKMAEAANRGGRLIYRNCTKNR